MRHTRKILLTALIAAGISSTAFAASFEQPVPASVMMEANTPESIYDAPYLGIQLGMNNKRQNVSYDTTASPTLLTNPVINESGNAKRRNIAQIQGGISKTFDRFYLAGEIFANLGFNFGTANSSSSTTLNNVVAVGDILTTKARGRIKYSYGLDIRPGFLITQGTVIYVIGGLQSSKMQLTMETAYNNAPYTENGLLSLKKSQNMMGYRYGIGLMQQLTDNLSARLEYVGVKFRKNSSNKNKVMNLSGSVLTTGTGTHSLLTSSSSYTPKDQSLIMIGLNYHFM